MNEKTLKRIIIVLIVLIVLSIFGLIYYAYLYNPKPKQIYTREYVPGGEGMVGDFVKTEWFPDKPEYDVVANDEGLPCFKDPQKAYSAFYKDFKDQIKVVKNKAGLLPFSRMTMKMYGHNTTIEKMDANDGSLENSQKISAFVSFYQRSFVSK